jgi:hypothetical protein
LGAGEATSSRSNSRSNSASVFGVVDDDGVDVDCGDGGDVVDGDVDDGVVDVVVDFPILSFVFDGRGEQE